MAKAHTTDPKRDPVAVAKYIGREYVESDRLPGEGSEEVARLYDGIADKVADLYEQIPVPVRFQEADPYNGYEEMAREVGRERLLRIYSGHTSHPHLSRVEQLQFRAVHDWHGHLKHDVDFTPSGEFTKWDSMRDHFTRDENSVLLGEVVGQVGAVHYLKGGFESDRYEQRAFIAPDRWSRLMAQSVYTGLFR